MKKNIDLLKDLVKSNELKQTTLEILRRIGCIRPKLYGLPKLNKPQFIFRPIISMIKSTQHKLEKLLNTQL